MFSDIVISIVKTKNNITKEREHWIRPGRSSQCWPHFLNDEVVTDEWKVHFRI